MTNKRLYIMRGISGSSKSTVAQAIADGLNAQVGNSIPDLVSIRSTDALFMVEGVYKFDQNRLGGFHMKNIYLVEEDMKNVVQCIIVDNTGIKIRDSKPYIALAKKYGYSITTIMVDAGLKEAKKRNATRTEDRKIPEHVLERQNESLEYRIDLDKEYDAK
jgi:predicted kinase